MCTTSSSPCSTAFFSSHRWAFGVLLPGWLGCPAYDEPAPSLRPWPAARLMHCMKLEDLMPAPLSLQVILSIVLREEGLVASQSQPRRSILKEHGRQVSHPRTHLAFTSLSPRTRSYAASEPPKMAVLAVTLVCSDTYLGLSLVFGLDEAIGTSVTPRGFKLYFFLYFMSMVISAPPSLLFFFLSSSLSHRALSYPPPSRPPGLPDSTPGHLLRRLRRRGMLLLGHGPAPVAAPRCLPPGPWRRGARRVAAGTGAVLSRGSGRSAACRRRRFASVELATPQHQQGGGIPLACTYNGWFSISMTRSLSCVLCVLNSWAGPGHWPSGLCSCHERRSRHRHHRAPRGPHLPHRRRVRSPPTHTHRPLNPCTIFFLQNR